MNGQFSQVTGRIAGLVLGGWLLGPAVALASEKVPANFGTGFVVSDQGHVVTAWHVVRDKSQVLLGPEGKNRFVVAQVLKVDEKNDLALLKSRLLRPPLPIARWEDVPVGLEALVIGYPQPRFLGLSRKVTEGIINGERGEGSAEGHFQLSAEVQKGNSGGPVLAPDGTVVGVVSAKLNALGVAERTKDLTQNVNYALKSTALHKFLESAGIAVLTRAPDLQVAVRPYQVYRKAGPSILAVIARNPPSGGKPPQAGRADDEVDKDALD